jgi:hypothetical protein
MPSKKGCWGGGGWGGAGGGGGGQPHPSVRSTPPPPTPTILTRPEHMRLQRRPARSRAGAHVICRLPIPFAPPSLPHPTPPGCFSSLCHHRRPSRDQPLEASSRTRGISLLCLWWCAASRVPLCVWSQKKVHQTEEGGLDREDKGEAHVCSFHLQTTQAPPPRHLHVNPNKEPPLATPSTRPSRRGLPRVIVRLEPQPPPPLPPLPFHHRYPAALSVSPAAATAAANCCPMAMPAASPCTPSLAPAPAPPPLTAIISA